MATLNFDRLVGRILRWSNRDPDVFGAKITLTDALDFSLPTGRDTVMNAGLIEDFINYAADKAYRILRVPPLEKTIKYEFATNDNGELLDSSLQPLIDGNYLPVPIDLIEFIHIRQVDAFGGGNSIVYNQKADTRTFHDFDSEKYDPRYTWTRQGNRILFPNVPGVLAGCTYEVYYYGRVGRVNATYNEVALNANLNTWRTAAGVEVTDLTSLTTDDSNGVLEVATAGTTLYTDGTTFFDENSGSLTPIIVDGLEAFNWLRDENERILLFGALAEAFAYLGEDDMMQKYEAMFGQEITTLNKEEEMRHASGGNVQINFNGRGLI